MMKSTLWSAPLRTEHATNPEPITSKEMLKEQFPDVFSGLGGFPVSHIKVDINKMLQL